MAPKNHIACVFFMVVLGILTYANHLKSPFQFDSVHLIQQNIEYKTPLDHFNWEFFEREYRSRSLLRITLALNVFLAKFNTFGFHLFNLLFHLINSSLIFAVSQNMLAQMGKHSSLGLSSRANTSSFLMAILFLCHPIQTESVVYIMSRSEILGATFYLGSFLIFQLGFQYSGRFDRLVRRGLVPGLIGMIWIIGFSIKQSVITLPCVLLVYYLCIVPAENGLLQTLLRWKWKIVVLALVTGGALFWKLLSDETFLIGPSQAGEVIGRKTYMLSQPPVMLFYYLKLLLFPFNLNIDPDIPWKNLSPAFLFALMMIISAITISFRYGKNRLLFFAAVWFFVVLSPSSSIITLLDLAAEHRVYLASFGFFMAFTLVVQWIFSRLGFKSGRVRIWMTAFSGFLILCCSLAVVERNKVWSGDRKLWEDVLKKSPHKVRPWMNLGRAHLILGNDQKAFYYYKRATELDPYFFASQYNLGIFYEKQNKMLMALNHFKAAAALNPAIPEAHGKLGEVYLKRSEYPMADIHLKKAVELNPLYAEAFHNLGLLHYFNLRNKKEGIAYFKRALRLNPNLPGASIVRKIVQTGQAP